MSPEATLALCRFALDAAATLWGAFAYLGFLVPRDLTLDVGDRLRSFRVRGAAVVAASSAALLPIQVATLADGWPDAINPGILSAVLTDTGVGRAWIVQFAAAGAPRRSRKSVRACRDRLRRRVRHPRASMTDRHGSAETFRLGPGWRAWALGLPNDEETNINRRDFSLALGRLACCPDWCRHAPPHSRRRSATRRASPC